MNMLGEYRKTMTNIELGIENSSQTIDQLITDQYK